MRKIADTLIFDYTRVLAFYFGFRQLFYILKKIVDRVDTFIYNGKIGLDGVTSAILGYSTTNDYSTAMYESVWGIATSTAHVDAGENTRNCQLF